MANIVSIARQLTGLSLLVDLRACLTSQAEVLLSPYPTK